MKFHLSDESNVEVIMERKIIAQQTGFCSAITLKCCVIGDYIKKTTAWNIFCILCNTKQSTSVRRFTCKEKLM